MATPEQHPDQAPEHSPDEPPLDLKELELIVSSSLRESVRRLELMSRDPGESVLFEEFEVPDEPDTKTGDSKPHS